MVCGTYPDEVELLKPSWENEGGMPYLTRDFSVVNPEYFRYADRRIKHLIDNGITPAIVDGWGRAVTLNAAAGGREIAMTKRLPLSSCPTPVHCLVFGS